MINAAASSIDVLDIADPTRPTLVRTLSEAGGDAKLVAVPTEKICPMYKNIQKLEDLPELLIQQIKHFFEHYKDLEPGKWVKVTGWDGSEAAKADILKSIEAAKQA